MYTNRCIRLSGVTGATQIKYIYLVDCPGILHPTDNTYTVCFVVLCEQVWQYVTLMKRIYLVDCPGIVYPTGATRADSVLKGVVSVQLGLPPLSLPRCCWQPFPTASNISIALHGCFSFSVIHISVWDVPFGFFSFSLFEVACLLR